ncbi:MAG: acetolactate synthase large subunit [Planctomycetota bacterium]|jgi:acetolactate synthase-1/2/3 large subunit
MKVSDMFVKCLENEGVERVFGVPGEENEDLLFSLETSPIEFVPTRHELGAAFMADVWGRLTGRAGVCLSTLGPGATNLITGIADANLDKSPLVAITAQGSTSRLHHESHQTIDIVGMFRPITKWNTAVRTPMVVPEVVRKAFKVAESEKPGATHIELPEDLAGREIGEGLSPLPVDRVRRPGPDHTAVHQAVELLAKSRRPLVIAGNGAIRRRASRVLTAMAKAHDIPVVSTFMGKGAISDRLDQSLVAIGLGFVKDFVREAVEASDMILAVGYDMAELSPENWNPTRDKKIIHIDFVPAEVYTHYAPEVEVVGDIGETLREIQQGILAEGLSFDGEWYRPIRKRIIEDIRSYTIESPPFTVPGSINVLRDVLAEDGLLISDVGTHKMWIARNYLTCVPNGCIVSNGLASMGIALPGAVAASLAEPGRPIVAAMGDGGFLMNAQELETAKRIGARFTALVFNDNDYGLISWKQSLSKGRSTGTRISNPDIVKFTESFGIAAYRPGSVPELTATLKRTLHEGELCVIEVPVDTGPNWRLVHALEDFWKGK